MGSWVCRRGFVSDRERRSVRAELERDPKKSTDMVDGPFDLVSPRTFCLGHWSLFAVVVYSLLLNPCKSYCRHWPQMLILSYR